MSTVIFLAWIWHYQCGRARRELHRAICTNPSGTFQYHVIIHLTLHRQLLWRVFVKLIRLLLKNSHLYLFNPSKSPLLSTPWAWRKEENFQIFVKLLKIPSLCVATWCAHIEMTKGLFCVRFIFWIRHCVTITNLIQRVWKF